MGAEMLEHERRAVIFSKGVFTEYPFQANTYGLPPEVVLDCVLGVLKARHPEDFGDPANPDRPATFREWVVQNFGEGIARHFMIPYNEKLLGVSLDELMAVADAGLEDPEIVMPEKSTFFQPKILSGLFLMRYANP